MPKSRKRLPAYQSHEIGLPEACGMPALKTRDFGVLERQHFLDAIFTPSPSPDDRYEPFRSFLIFRMVKAARNFTLARATVLAQIAEAKRWKNKFSGGQGLPILEFAAAFDDCLSDLFAIGRTIHRMSKHSLANMSLLKFIDQHGSSLDIVEAMRSVSDHMDKMIEKRNWRGGPTRPFISKTGTHGMVGRVSIDLGLLAPLLDDLFAALKITFEPSHPDFAFPTGKAKVL